MPMTFDEIEKEALALPSEARAHLAGRLLENAQASRIDELWAAEAKRRRDEVRQGRVKTIPGPEGLARVRRSLGRRGLSSTLRRWKNLPRRPTIMPANSQVWARA